MVAKRKRAVARKPLREVFQYKIITTYPQFLEDLLNKMGRDSWEAVVIVEVKKPIPDSVDVIFKRKALLEVTP